MPLWHQKPFRKINGSGKHMNWSLNYYYDKNGNNNIKNNHSNNNANIPNIPNNTNKKLRNLFTP